jgi:hypothetical protein
VPALRLELASRATQLTTGPSIPGANMPVPGGSYRRAESYAHGLPDYNGHYGVRELCDICPARQVSLCRSAHRVPSAGQIYQAACALPETDGRADTGWKDTP